MNNKALSIILSVHFMIGVALLILGNDYEFVVFFIAAVVLELILTLISYLIRKLAKKEWLYFIPQLILVVIVIPILYISAINASGWNGLGYMLIALVLVIAVVLSVPNYFIFIKLKDQ